LNGDLKFRGATLSDYHDQDQDQNGERPECRVVDDEQRQEWDE
jgi:hypothetical protein